MPIYLRTLASVLVILGVAAAAGAQGRDILPPVPTPTDIKPGSITCDECPYPTPSKYLNIDVYSQDVRISYMDIAPTSTANGHVVLLMHGNNFGGFYFGDIIDGLTDAGFRVIVPDQIGYGKSSKPIAPYNFNTQARNTQLILEHEGIDKVMAVGHSMGGMLATRFTTQYPDSVERLVIYNPHRPFRQPVQSPDDAGRSELRADPPDRLPEHPPEPEPVRRARPGGLERQVRALHPHPLVVDPQLRLSAPRQWCRRSSARCSTRTRSSTTGRISTCRRSPFGGAEDLLLGPAEVFQERMQVLADTIPNGNVACCSFPGWVMCRTWSGRTSSCPRSSNT